MTASVLFIAQLAVMDIEAFRRDYAAPLQPINARHGVEVVAVSPKAEVLEGKAGSLVAVLRFRSREAFDAWYGDPEYALLLARRRELTDAARSTVTLLVE